MFTKLNHIGRPVFDVVDTPAAAVCGVCGGSGWRPVEGDRLARCQCWGERRTAQALATAGVPARYSDARLGGYRPASERQKLALDDAKRFLKAFPATRGLWISGEPGTGKTHLAVAVLRSAIAGKAATGVFTGAGELLHAIRHTYQGDAGTELSVLDRVTKADVLVLDDIGSDKPTDWATSTLGSIVNDRYNAERPTIFTSTLVDLKDQTDPRSIAYVLGVRTRSRLCEMCKWITL